MSEKFTQAQLERKAREVAEKWIKPEPFVPPANWRNATAAQIPPTVITLTNKPYEDVIKELTSLIAAALGEAVDEAVAGARLPLERIIAQQNEERLKINAENQRNYNELLQREAEQVAAAYLAAEEYIKKYPLNS